MTYGHAERNLAAIRLVEAETIELLNSLAHLDPEQAQWLHDVADATARSRSTSTPDPAVHPARGPAAA